MSFTITVVAQQIIKPYGGYIQVSKLNMDHVVNIDVIIYYPNNSAIPDSVYIAGTSQNGYAYKNGQELLCNNIFKQIYSRKYIHNIPDANPNLTAFLDSSTRFIGKNAGIGGLVNFFLFCKVSFSTFGYALQTMSFKDKPLITIEKGKTASVNFVQDYHPCCFPLQSFFRFWVNYTPSIPSAPDGIFLNKVTGDIFIDSKKLDTGYYSIFLNNEDYFSNSPNYNFTIHVVDSSVSYFNIPVSQLRDSLDIPYVKALQKDSIINYQIDYINTHGIKNYSVNWQSALVFKKLPHIITTKINDSTLHIDLKVFIDSAAYIFDNNDTVFFKTFDVILPTSVSIIVKTIDSIDNNKEDMTSFYITNDALTGINQINNYQTENIKIYPNPTSFDLHIETSSTERMNIQLFDITGKSITANISFTNSTTINISSLSQGIYFLKITDMNSGMIKTQKVAVVK